MDGLYVEQPQQDEGRDDDGDHEVPEEADTHKVEDRDRDDDHGDGPQDGPRVFEGGLWYGEALASTAQSLPQEHEQ